MYDCWYCGSNEAWVGDFMESEVTGGDIAPENDGVVGYYTCPSCGSDYEFRQGPKGEEDEG